MTRKGLKQLIDAAKKYKADPPGSVKIHYDETGFFRYVYDTEEQGVLDGLKDYMKDMPAYQSQVFPCGGTQGPEAFSPEDLYSLLPINQKQVYSFDDVLARLVDGSEHMEYRPGYGPESLYRVSARSTVFPWAVSATGRAIWEKIIPNMPIIRPWAASSTGRVLSR